MKKIIVLIVIMSTLSCTKKTTVDAILIQGNIYTVNNNFDKAEAFAVNKGKIIAVGTTKEIQSLYTSNKVINAKGKTVLPGLIDAHCHFFGLGLQQQKVDVSGTKSYEEVLQRIVDFQKENNTDYITGRGWDQNDWEVKKFPTKEKLDKLFPKTPVAITRIDGHALLANQAAINLAKVTVKTPFSGGEILQKNGKLTGVFIDNPMELILNTIPKPTKETQIKALQDAEKICISYGLTTVDDAGLSRNTIELIDSLQKANQLKIKIYAMVANTPKDVDYYLKKGIFKTNRLNVRSIKVYADGALGSRGAALKKPYADMHHHFGALLSSPKEFKKLARKIAASNYQMNSHAIGDSANYVMLKTYKEALNNQKNRRWRIEHAQIIDPKDFHYFKSIFPSIQPTHATSDMYWAIDRLGAERLKGAYAYKDLLNEYGKVALGTDFPVEKVSPFLTFYAAVARKDLTNYPKNGFQMENALSREETLKGMTIWAAYSNFEENEKGSIETGKFADFVILDKNIMEVASKEIPYVKAVATFINGEKIN